MSGYLTAPSSKKKYKGSPIAYSSGTDVQVGQDKNLEANRESLKE